MLLIPMVILVSICFYNLWDANRRYDDMIHSAVAASEFSLNFKEDIDYETYLLIVENKSLDESTLDELLNEANYVINDLNAMTESNENSKRLKSVKKYLRNLAVYKRRIEENLLEGNKYADNIEIWENDVQVVTTLIKESVLQYIYYEIQDIQQAKDNYQDFYLSMIRVMVIAFGCIIILTIFLSYYVPRSITSPIQEISKVTDQVAKGDLTVKSHVKAGAEVGVLNDSLNAMIDKINELLSQVTKEQIRLRNAELELLQSQINPHFLYNTLDTIIWLAEAGDQKAVVSMVQSLSEFFRTTLSRGKDVIPLKDEIQHAKSYLEIQQVRYRDILDYEIDVPEELYSYQIPKITLQPIVENALYHGIKNKRGLGKIIIQGVKEEDYYLICIKDNGIGMTQERLEKVSNQMRFCPSEEKEIYGLFNVNERIHLKFGDSYGIRIESEYKSGTDVWIKLPLQQTDEVRK